MEDSRVTAIKLALWAENDSGEGRGTGPCYTHGFEASTGRALHNAGDRGGLSPYSY